MKKMGINLLFAEYPWIAEVLQKIDAGLADIVMLQNKLLLKLAPVRIPGGGFPGGVVPDGEQLWFVDHRCVQPAAETVIPNVFLDVGTRTGSCTCTRCFLLFGDL